MNSPTRRYEIILEREAERDYGRLRGNDLQRIDQALQDLEVNPRPSGCKKLQGPTGFYSLREGTWRIIYAIEDARLVILVIRIKHRSEAYRGL